MKDKNGRYQHWWQEDLPARVSNRVTDIEPIEVHAAVLWINSEAGCKVLSVEPDSPIYFSAYDPNRRPEGVFSTIAGSARRWGNPIQQCEIRVNPQTPNRVSVIVHELMHCLGFGHDSDQVESIMTPGLTPFGQIQPEDAMLMHKLYCR